MKLKKLEQQIGSIDIRKFMHQYYGVVHKDIGKMTHDVVIDFFPHLRRTSFSHIDKNPELLRYGKIVLVKDTNNNLAPYITPNTAHLSENPQFDIGVLIEYIISSLKITAQLSESTVIVIEGEKSLDELVDKDEVTMNAKNLPQTLVEITSENDVDGVVVNIDGDVQKIRLKHNSLEDLSAKTDSIAIVLEEDQSISFISNGVTQTDFDFIMLRAGLYITLELSQEDEDEVEIELFDIPSREVLASMSNYQLVSLMHSYKRTEQKPCYYAVRREIKRRKNNDWKKEKVKQKLYRGDEFK